MVTGGSQTTIIIAVIITRPFWYYSITIKTDLFCFIATDEFTQFLMTFLFLVLQFIILFNYHSLYCTGKG